MTNFAIDIRDAAIERLKPLGRYAPEGSRPGTPARIRRTPVMPPQIADVPCLLIYLGNQTMAPPGDANAGPPDFLHELQLVISSVLKADSEDGLDDVMAEAGMEVLETLLEDKTWLDLIEGVTSVTQQSRFDTSQYLAAIVMTTITVAFRTTWPPRIAADNFAEVQMRTGDEEAGARGATYSLPSED